MSTADIAPENVPERRGVFTARAARPLHLLRLLSARLPDVRADERGDVLAARAHQPDAGARDRRVIRR